MRSEPRAIATATILADRRATRRESSGPAGGLLIAVGCSLILWAVIAEAAKLVAAHLF